MIEIDGSDLARLDVAFTQAERRAQAGVLPVVKKAAQNVKEGMAADAKGHPHFVSLPDSISYDIIPLGLRTVSARIGPDKRKRQGALGNIFYYGTATQPPVGDVTAALRRERPNLEAALAALVAL